MEKSIIKFTRFNAENQQSICQPLAQKYPHIKFIIPQAPTISVSMNYGFSMPAWYNIKGNPRDIMSLKEDKPSLLNSVNQIKKIIQEEVNSGVSPQKIMVVGHSQGASVALTVGLTSDYRLAGVLVWVLSCHVGMRYLVEPNQKIKLFLFFFIIIIMTMLFRPALVINRLHCWKKKVIRSSLIIYIMVIIFSNQKSCKKYWPKN
ncbi:MAG: hypothetical protein I3273_05710 [Candidatus Moeniiplasma glomeromycotorum]|nr:hypothetical protein [Candidatus Moeniiplasma glomeromycotorum]MCE8168458.1 hypothetical protein [Candidatus Moeniiplasma glomeromycotorum]MCE8169582.1 hypothetical protein [Candidatus Moeniiplasma glomeromycotorum]